jgi:hypothetical protein
MSVIRGHGANWNGWRARFAVARLVVLSASGHCARLRRLLRKLHSTRRFRSRNRLVCRHQRGSLMVRLSASSSRLRVKYGPT